MKFLEINKNIAAVKNATIKANDVLKELKDSRDSAVHIAQDVVSEKLSHDTTYQALKMVVALKEQLKPIEKMYGLWFLTGHDGDDWEYETTSPETEDVLEPIIQVFNEQINLARRKMDNMFYEMYRDVSPEYIEEFDKKVKRQEETITQLVEDNKRLHEQLKFGCEDLILPGHEVDALQGHVQSIVKNYKQEPFFDVNDNGDIIITGQFGFSISQDVELDEFYNDDNIEEKFSFDDDVDSCIDRIIEEIKSKISSDYNVDISYESNDPEISGDIAYNKRYYESDTGYSEPEGYFYDGTVTMYSDIDVIITISKEVK